MGYISTKTKGVFERTGQKDERETMGSISLKSEIFFLQNDQNMVDTRSRCRSNG